MHRAFAQNNYAAAYDEVRVGRKQAPPKGFITEDDFDHCIGSSPIGLFDKNLGEGFHAHDSAGNPTRSYDRNITARIGAFKPEGWTQARNYF